MHVLHHEGLGTTLKEEGIDKVCVHVHDIDATSLLCLYITLLLAALNALHISRLKESREDKRQVLARTDCLASVLPHAHGFPSNYNHAMQQCYRKLMLMLTTPSQ